MFDLMFGLKLDYCRQPCSILLIILLNEILLSEEFRWTTIPGSITYAHKGENKNLTWEFKEEGDKIIRLEWYFKSTLICFTSDAGDFQIEEPSYQGRIERIGKSGLQLNNVSIDDEGTYTLNLVIQWSSTTDMQNVTLKILAPPTDSCLYNISCIRQSKGITCDIMQTVCGGQEVSAVQKGSTAEGILSNGYYLYFNLGSYKDTLHLCRNEKAMECVDGFRQECPSIPIQPPDDKSLSRSNDNTQQSKLFTTAAPEDMCICSTLQHHDQSIYILISCIVLILMILLSLILLVMNRGMCIKKLETEILEMRQQYMPKDLGTDPNESDDSPLQRGGFSEGGMIHQPIRTNGATILVA